MIIYGSHVATTMIPILGELIAFAMSSGSSEQAMQRWTLVAIYLPYLIVPLLLTAEMCLCAEVFPQQKPGSKAQKAKRK